MAKVLIPLADGFEEIEALAVVDVLRRGGVEVVTASLNATLEVHASHDVTVKADALLTDVLAEPYEAIVLPGGAKGSKNLGACEPLLARLREQKESGALVCAICAAPLVLQKAGVLENEGVTCYPSCAPEMERHVNNVPVMEDGLVITGQGAGAAILFGLVILKRLTNERFAHQIANSILVDLR